MHRKAESKRNSKATRSPRHEETLPEIPTKPTKRDTTPIKPMTEVQKRYVNAIKSFQLIFATGPAGTGKAQPLDAKIATPTGFVRMGELKVGDNVIGSNGETVSVTGVFPQGEKDIYTIKFEDGRSTECCDDHLWRIYCYEWKDKWQTVKTSELRKLIGMKSYRNRLYVQLVEPVKYDGVKLPLHPYVIGAIIGDGHVLNRVMVSSSDIDLVDRIERLLPDGYEVVHRANWDFDIVKISRTKREKNFVLDTLCELGINVPSYEKSIPEIYMKGDVAQRIELLQGLFDTDGTVSSNGYSVSFCSTSQKLAEQVQELIRSVGGIAKITKKTTYFTYKGERKSGRESYNVNCRLKNPEILFTLKRKKELAEKNIQYRDSLRLRVSKIELTGKKQAQCISVAASDHLYVTDDYVVTHNTWLCTALAAQELEAGNIDKIIITRPAVEAGENLGFLPGEIEEKFDPYLQPFRDVLNDRLGKSFSDYLIKSGKIEAAPLAYMRGRTFKNAFVILDEAQNTTPSQMRMFLTRIGQNCRVVVNGDITQKDIKTDSGLEDAVNRLSHIPAVKLVQFTKADVVRSGIVQEIIEAYEQK